MSCTKWCIKFIRQHAGQQNKKNYRCRNISSFINARYKNIVFKGLPFQTIKTALKKNLKDYSEILFIAI